MCARVGEWCGIALLDPVATMVENESPSDPWSRISPSEQLRDVVLALPRPHQRKDR